jgi:hypothetical protein
MGAQTNKRFLRGVQGGRFFQKKPPLAAGGIYLIITIIFTALIFPKHHPDIKWREIAGPRFIVVFPQGYENEASYTLETAHQLYGDLIEIWKTSPPLRGKIRILLSDIYDQSNGSATFFPYNQIEIYLFTPPPDSTIGSGKDWIRLVLTHELTHIITFNYGSGLTYFLRGILGAHPILYPTIYIPNWMMEGIAIFAESRLNAGGRLNTPDYKILLKYISQSDSMPNWRSIWGDPTPWPGSASRYLYGAAFTAYLAETYGIEKIRQLILYYARRPVPLASTSDGSPLILNTRRRFKQVFKKDIAALWKEFLQYTHAAYAGGGNSDASPVAPITFLTRDGKYKRHPLLTAGGVIYYVDRDYRQYPGIYQLDSRTGKRKRLLKKTGVTGLHYARGENKIYFSAADNYRFFYHYNDIYVLAPRTGSVRRLSRGRRLSHPVKGPGKPGVIYCVKRQRAASYLAALDPGTGRERILSRGFDGLAHLAISPDQRYIAASLKPRNKPWGIALFNLDGKLERFLTEGGEKSYYPVWKNENELFFVHRQGDRYQLASLCLRDSAVYIYSAPRLHDLRYFSLSPGGRRLAASFFDANGYNLGIVELETLEKKQAPPVSAPGAIVSPPPRSRGHKIKSYNFPRELAPKYIDFNYRYAGMEIQPGISLSGHDLLLRHQFTFQGFYGFKSRTPNIAFTYTYDGLYPTLSLSYSDLTDLENRITSAGVAHNERKLKLSALFPLFIKERSQVYLYGDAHLEWIQDKYPFFSYERRSSLSGTTLGIFYNTAQRYYDAISLSDGQELSLSYARESMSVKDGGRNINTAALEYKRYITLHRPNVLALRLAVVDSWGERKRIFHMGGARSYSGFHTADSGLLELMRGFPLGYFSGTGGCLFNLEYRVSLLKIERVFTVSRSIERLYLSFFADIGSVWHDKKIVSPSYSLGAELNLLLYLGDIKFNVCGGAALGRRPGHSPILYLRIGNSF